MRVAILLLAGCALAQGKQLVKSKDFGIHIWTTNSQKCHLLHLLKSHLCIQGYLPPCMIGPYIPKALVTMCRVFDKCVIFYSEYILI